MIINADKIRIPQVLFFIYIIAASLLIMIFRYIIPGSEPPLLIYSGNWRLIQGFLEVFNLYPALAFSAIVIPFGLASYDDNFQSFSDVFFKRLLSSVVTAIIATVIYGLIFFFAFPLVKNNEEKLRFNGELYHLARNNMIESINEGSWFEASQFLGICDNIWFNDKDRELTLLRDEISINLNGFTLNKTSESPNVRTPEFPVLSNDPAPVNATQAIEMSRNAFEKERYFDSHWLANLGARLAVDGSVEQANALQLSNDAWNMISSLAPSHAQTRLHELYNFKLSGYQAMDTGEWIRAYYIFQELLTLTPNDPDAANFLAASEREAKKAAFFIDEMELSVGEILNGAVFSLPNGDNRAVLRFSSLTLSADIAYGFGFDYMDFDDNMDMRSNGTARYVKIAPVTFKNPAGGNENDSAAKHQIIVMTHSLDRYDQENFYQCEWQTGREPVGGILLDISFEDFLLLANVRRGLSNLQTNDLFEAANKMEKAGYVKQIFQAEILNRIGTVLFFLPMSVFVIIIAWRYRVKKKPRYFFVLMLPILPVVFHAFIFLYRAVFNALGIWLILGIGFTAALFVYLATLAVTLFISLIVLSAQHS